MEPSDAPDLRVRWSSADTSVGTIDEETGELTSVAPGTATVKATSTMISTESDSVAASVVLATGVPDPWKLQFGTEGIDYAYGLAIDPDGGMIVVGITGGKLGDRLTRVMDAFVRRLDESRAVSWTSQLGLVG